MSVETGKKIIESFAEIKNKKSVVFVIYQERIKPGE